MRLLASFVLAACLGVLACAPSLAAPPRSNSCATLAVSNHNFNRVVISLAETGERVGAVEGFTEARLRVCNKPSQAASFVLEGMADSFRIELSTGALLDSSAVTHLDVGPDPRASLSAIWVSALPEEPAR